MFGKKKAQANEVKQPEIIPEEAGNAGRPMSPLPTRDNILETRYSLGINAIALERELKKNVVGEVRFDNGGRALYSTDASNYKQIPIGVVVPKTEEDIIRTVAACRKFNAPVLTRGGGTSLAGQCCNVAVVMDFSQYHNKIISSDKEKKLVTVQTGIVLDHMRHEIEGRHKLTFGPDPATHTHCTIGGMLGNNSCGPHSVMAQFEGMGSRTSDNVESMVILTYDGLKMKVGPTSNDEYEAILREGGRKAEIYRGLMNLRNKYADAIRKKFPNIPRRVSGYNLPDLLPENGFNVAKALIGSENTLVTILEATLHLLDQPQARVVLLLGYPDVYEAGRHVHEIMMFKPIALEGLDQLLIQYNQKKGIKRREISLFPHGHGWLLVEFGGNSRIEAEAKAEALMAKLKGEDAPTMRLVRDPLEQKMIWEVRESGLGATAWVPGEEMSVPGWEDSAVDPRRVGEYLKELRALFSKFEYNPSLYGHFGQGCIHCRVQFDLLTQEGLEKYKRFTVEAANLVVKYGGSISGEHGDGQSRADLLEIMYGKEIMQAFREFKEIWDPQWKMNPGKIIEPYGQLSNLRISNHYSPKDIKTQFSYTKDEHSFARATLRCVGVGNCRQTEEGTMCPSYMVTHEEEHSTRGRARLLFEMVEGDVLTKGWKDRYVKEALDLCLSCKGCKGDCPVNVDMATYKSEFLSHYYEGKIRPASAYAFGLIYWWSRMASLAPGIANFFTQTWGLNNLVKTLGGIEQKRQIPKFAPQTFRSNFKRQHAHANASPAKKVILWPDTFNNFFQPEVLQAGVEVLEAIGWEVVIPKQQLCCGRPLYDYGMLGTAKKLLRQTLASLREDIENGIPVVGLEPSCVSVFRDELCGMLPTDRDALRLREQVFTLGEFLDNNARDFEFPLGHQKAMVHMHCHHKAIMKTEAENKILRSTGLDFSIPDTGCCGMAGGFGYEKGRHYEVSVAAGERVLLPAVRHAERDTLIITDGFSCREQIEQQTGRKPIHTAQALQMALRQR